MIYLKTVVGAYAGDHGFPLPNPVSIHPEYPRSRFRIARCMQTLQKMKILGVECSGIMMPKTAEPPQTIPRSHRASRDGDMDGVPHISDGDPNVLNANRNDDGRYVNAYNDNPSNQWDDDGAFAFPVLAS